MSIDEARDIASPRGAEPKGAAQTQLGGGSRKPGSGPPLGYFLVVPPGEQEGAMSFAELSATLAKSWKTLAVASFVSALIMAGISLPMRNVYRGQVIVAPVTEDSTMSGESGGLHQLGGLAALAGINIGAGADRREEEIATLSSMGFAREFISGEDLMPVLFPDNWNPRTKQWKPGKVPPTLEDAALKFTQSVSRIATDQKTGLVVVTVEWTSPELAARWANEMVDRVNDRLRAEAIRNADLSIEYLNKELKKTSVVQIQQAIYQLIESQINKAMMANVQREYAFRVIDPAYPSKHKVRPKRAIMVLVGAAVGLFFGAIFVFARRALAASRSRS
jgi:uncharacterized protein involved in exopolysaccharide biosynthesis